LIIPITIVELPEYIKRVEKLLDEKKRDDLLYYLSSNPKSGTLIQGSGGIRKLRWASKGKGKSGGARVIYLFYNETIPLFLLTIFGKNEKADLSKAERNELAKLVNELIDNYKR
jgi:hypothetical protein